MLREDIEGERDMTFDLSDNQPVGGKEFLSFFVGGQLFGIPVLQVQDVISSEPVAPIPLSPQEILGSINLRGRIVTVVDLHFVLSLERPDTVGDQHNVVVECGDEAYSLQVDDVGEVLMLNDADFEACPSTLDKEWRRVSSGLYRIKEGLLIVLDVPMIVERSYEAAA